MYIVFLSFTFFLYQQVLFAYFCSAALCPDPPTLVNGIITFTGNSVGDTATYICDQGFELIGISIITCTVAADGNSAIFPTVSQPECRREYAINMTSTVYSIFQRSLLQYVYKMELTYECLAGPGLDTCK